MVDPAQRQTGRRQSGFFDLGWHRDFKIHHKRITADVVSYDPVLFKWMVFLTCYVLPKAYFEKVGPQGFEAKPIGSGPYMVDAYEGNAYLRLKAHPTFGAEPPFETVVFQFVPDATTRIAEIESASDLTLEVPYEEYDRLKGKAGLKGVCKSTCDLGLLFITNGGVMDDKNVRLAMFTLRQAEHHQAAIARYGTVIDTLKGPGYAAFDPTIKLPFDPELQRSPCRQRIFQGQAGQFTIQTTRGFKPKDYK